MAGAVILAVLLELVACGARGTAPGVYLGGVQHITIYLVVAPDGRHVRPEVTGLGDSCLASSNSMDQDLTWGGTATAQLPLSSTGGFSLLAVGGESAQGLVFTMSGHIGSDGIAQGSFSVTVPAEVQDCSIPAFQWLAVLQPSATAPPTPSG